MGVGNTDLGRLGKGMTVGNPSSSLGKDFPVRPFWKGCTHILVNNLSPVLLLEGNPINSLVPRVNLCRIAGCVLKGEDTVYIVPWGKKISNITFYN